MPGGDIDPGVVPLERAELVIRDMDEIAVLIGQLYAEHRARFSFADPASVQAGNRSATAGPLLAGRMHWDGVDYQVADARSGGHLLGVVAVDGAGTLTTGRERLSFARGDVFLDPPVHPYAADLHECTFAVLQVPWSAASDVAEERTGLPADSLRFESMAPVSASAAAVWTQTVAFGCRQLIDSGAAEISSLIAQEMTRLTASVLLETFPNTTMTLPYVQGPGWVPPAAVRRATAFIEASAGQPITLADIAGNAGVTGRALQYAFRRHYGTTPTGYLRRVRLERAHRELRAARSSGGATVRIVARKWGWANPAQFAATYRKHYEQSPSRTLRA
jgi:AraC-like DNA-binding protein